MPILRPDYRLIRLRTGSGTSQEDRRSLTTTLRNRCPSPRAEAPDITNTAKFMTMLSKTANILISYPPSFLLYSQSLACVYYLVAVNAAAARGYSAHGVPLQYFSRFKMWPR